MKITDKMRLDWLNEYLEATNKWAELLPAICRAQAGPCFCNDEDVRKSIDAAIVYEKRARGATR